MNKIFEQWSDDLIPVNLKLDENKKKIAKPYKWKNGETYTQYDKLNSIGLRTGSNSINVIDVDTKDFAQLTEPFKGWVEDRMMFEDTLIVESANGYHFYVDTGDFKLRTSTKTGANKSEIPFIDFRGEGGMIFISSKVEGIGYKVLSAEQPMKIEADLIAYLPQWEKPIIEVKPSNADGFENLDDTEDTSKTVMNEYGGLKTAFDIQELLEPISSECDRDTWMQLLASAYNLAENKEEVKDVCQAWSEKAENYTERGFNDVWKQLRGGGYGVPFKGGMLVKMYNDITAKAKEKKSKSKFTDYSNKVKASKSVEEIKDLFDEKWTAEPICSDAQQKALYGICKTRANDLEKLDGTGIKHSVDDFKPLVLIEKKKEVAEIKGISCYHFDNKYHVIKGDKLKDDLNKLSLFTTGSGLGYAGSDFEAYVVNKSKLIQGIKRETDYMTKNKVMYELRESNNPSEFDYLHVLTNPLHKDITYPKRQDIIDDFCTNIWKGKAEEAIKLIGLTIRFGETKLNKIHLVAPSNTGKTTMFENIGFQTIHMKRLVQALNADKGIGKKVIDGLKASGFLLIDEANAPLTQDIKNIDNYIQLDQFGQGGTQDIKLHYTVLTSTHKQAIRNMSDEMYNRLLIIELGKDEPDYSLDKSSLFINENEAYSKTLTQYFMWLLKDMLTNPKYKKKDLMALQNKHRLELNNDIDDMLYEISERVLDSLRAQASSYGDVLEKQGDYYIKRKKDLVGMVDDLLSEHAHVDVGKYSDVLVSHFMPDTKAKSIKVEGKPIKYYPLHMKPYFTNIEDAIIDEFEDLDEF